MCEGADHSKDISKAVQHLQGDGLFKHIPGRCHMANAGFVYDQRMQSKEKYTKKIQKLSKKLD